MKKVLRSFLFILVLFILCFVGCAKTAQSDGKLNVKVVIDSEVVCEKQVDFLKGNNLVDLLKEDSEIKLSGTNSEYGFTITGVCGVEASSKGETYYWKILVDGGYSSVGISSIELVDGMEISLELVDWTLETWE